MNRRTLLLLGSLLISTIIGACKPSQAELEAQDTKIAVDIFSTQTAQAPTATTTLIPSPTNTPTITPTITTSVPPTNTPTINPTPLLNIPGVVLTLEDLPPGFEEILPEEFGFTAEDLSSEGLTVESVFTFMQVEPLGLIMGFTTQITSPVDQLGFDIALTQPEFLMEALIGGMEPLDIHDQRELPGLAVYGDASAGLTLATDIGGIVMRMDLAVLRRDVVGAFLFSMYIDGDIPAITIDEIASKMDERIIEAIPPSN